jgi:hypothetical protein
MCCGPVRRSSASQGLVASLVSWLVFPLFPLSPGTEKHARKFFRQNAAKDDKILTSQLP